MSDEAANNTSLALIEEQADARIRRVWIDDRWYFSVIDVIGLLTDSRAPAKYWTAMKARITSEGFSEAVMLCRSLKVTAADGKLRETDCADLATVMMLLSTLPAWRRNPGRRGQDLDLAACDTGIYAITNILTQEQYIGSSSDISARFDQHRALLLRGEHHAKHLQEAWDQYGAEHFRFELLESVPDSQRLPAIEQEYLTEYQPAYNSAAVALNSSAALPISADHVGAVLMALCEISGMDTSETTFRTTMQAIARGSCVQAPTSTCC